VSLTGFVRSGVPLGNVSKQLELDVTNVVVVITVFVVLLILALATVDVCHFIQLANSSKHSR